MHSPYTFAASIWFLSVALLPTTVPPAHAFKIVEPTAPTPLQSGKTATASVDLGRDEGVVKVRYYWYPENGESLIEQSDQEAFIAPAQPEGITGQPIVATPAMVGLSDSTPAFGGKLKVPAEAVGMMRLLAVADISRGRLGTRTAFDEVLVKVEPPAELTSIDFETEKPFKLGRIGPTASYEDIDAKGKLIELPIVGLFADGITRPIANPSTGTTIASSDETVIKVEAFGLLRLVGSGRTVLTATNRGKSATLEVLAALSEEPNEPPVAEIGPSRTVKSGTKVKLNGLKSRDPEGEALFYYWSQVRGGKVALLDVNGTEASFQAPQVSEPRTYRFKLRVTDKKGADSLPAFVDVTVEP